MTLAIPRVLQAWEAEGIPVGGEGSARVSPGAGQRGWLPGRCV